MANRRLLIHYFGPIQHADVQLHNLTVFVGPQATGKSLAMQLCYFMQWLERLVIPMDELGADFHELLSKLPDNGVLA
jgi:predicted ATPase